MDYKKWRREKTNATQVDVAIEVGVSLSTICNWESGVTKPTLENKVRLEATLRKFENENKKGDE